MSDWTLLRFHKVVPEAQALMRQLVARVYAFCDELDSDANANLMVSSLLAHFQTDLPAMFGLGILRDGHLVGHLLCQIENYYSQMNLAVLQYELDEAPPREFHKVAYQELIDIAVMAGATKIIAICPDDKVVRIHKLFHHMEVYATIMSYDLTEEREEKIKEVSNG